MERFEIFLTEREYFKNVSDKKLVYYRWLAEHSTRQLLITSGRVYREALVIE
jgi:hypothetical protein